MIEEPLLSATAKSVSAFLSENRRFDTEECGAGKFYQALSDRLQNLELTVDSEYIDLLQARPVEVNELLALISRNTIFSDLATYEVLRERIVPALAQGPETIRVWVPQCGEGQDVYALAVLLSEALGADEFRRRVKIFATDSSEDNLIKSRQASYEPGELTGLPDEVLHRYFIQQGPRLTFRADLRRSIVFGKHQLLSDAPIGRMDLISCRYFLSRLDEGKQNQALARVRFSLNANRFLLVAPGERVLPGLGFDHMEPPTCLINSIGTERAPVGVIDSSNTVTDEAPAILDMVFNSSIPAHIVVDNAGIIALINAQASSMFQISSADIGKPLKDLEFSYRPLELRTLIDVAQRENRNVTVPRVKHTVASRTSIFEVTVCPLVERDERVGVSIQYVDVTLQQDLENKLTALNEQLQTANEELQSAQEELITTNEELQSTNEELETTNEELQSTNEELETMNEELRSTNNELEITNTEQSTLSEQVRQTNTFLSAILGSIQSSVIVLDKDLTVLIWNRGAVELTGLRSEESCGSKLPDLDVGLPVAELTKSLEKFLADGKKYEELELKVLNRRGKDILCRVQVSTHGTAAESGLVLIISNSPTLLPESR